MKVFPRRMNLGSGKDFREDCLNVDINPAWNPDIVMDMARGIFLTRHTERFGMVSLQEGFYDEIIAGDVLEHIPDLVSAMTNCLKLLRVGGVMKITVPYDLSLGAASDPTHLHGFNERSWVYYCEWFWYLSWRDYRFKVNKLDYQVDESLPPWRQICAMQVELEKIETTEEEKKQALNYYDRKK